jgi:hypothetical protein
MKVIFKDAKFTEKQAAEYLGKAPSSLNKWRFRNVGPVYLRENASIRYLQSDLDAWLQSCRVVPKERKHKRRGAKKHKSAKP